MSYRATKKKQRKCYSGKKKQHTVKGQVVLDSNLRIICTTVAMTNTHDFKLFKKSRLPIRKETLICVDTGYLGLANFHKNIEMPKKKTKLNPLTKEDKLENKSKSSKRIPVEHINAKIKAFKIVATKYRNRRKKFGLRFNLICALVNFDRGFAVI